MNLFRIVLVTVPEKDVLELAQHHGSVLHLVVELQALNKVLVGAGVLGLLHLVVDGVELQRNED